MGTMAPHITWGLNCMPRCRTPPDINQGRSKPCETCPLGQQSDPAYVGFCGPCPSGTATYEKLPTVKGNPATGLCVACPINTTALKEGLSNCDAW